MYRSVTLRVLRSGMLDELRRDAGRVAELLREMRIEFRGDRVFLDGEDVSDAIRENGVSREVSFVSSLKPVRDRLLELQQSMGATRGVVMDGRDIGTVVFPDAELKIFLVADPRERAKRRYAELDAKGGSSIPTVEELEEEIRQRDRDDEQRTLAPLKRHPEAVVVDTSLLTIDEQVSRVYGLAKEVLEG